MEEKKVRKRNKKKLTISQIKRGNGIQVRSVISRMKAREVELTIISVVSILIVILITAFFTFSSVQKTGENNILRTGGFNVSFNDDNKGLGDIISLVNSDPLDDQDGLKTKPYYFTITNNRKGKSTYVVKLEMDYDMIEADKCQDKLLEVDVLKYSIDGEKPISLKGMKDSYQIFSETLSGEEEVNHSIRIWVSNTFNDDMSNKHFHSKIVVRSLDDTNDEIIQ